MDELQIKPTFEDELGFTYELEYKPGPVLPIRPVCGPGGPQDDGGGWDGSAPRKIGGTGN